MKKPRETDSSAMLRKAKKPNSNEGKITKKKETVKPFNKSKLADIIESTLSIPKQVREESVAVDRSQAPEKTAIQKVKVPSAKKSEQTSEETENLAINKGASRKSNGKNKKKKKSSKPVEVAADERLESDNKDEESLQATEGSKLNPEQEKRTIFVGNVHISATKRDVTQFFSKYGKIEAVRFRSVAGADPAESKKISLIKKHFHEKRCTFCAYVRFEDEESVTAALESNNEVFLGTHIRVDRALGGKEIKPKCAIFLGNVPFEAEEDDIRDLFEMCGEIESIRIIHDKQHGSGKGFAYVNFKTADAVELALQMEDISLLKRKLRVQRYMSKDQVARKTKKINKNMRWGGKKGTMKLGFMAEKEGTDKTVKSSDYRGDRFMKKKMAPSKKNKKMKAKSAHSLKKKMAIAQMLTGSKAAVKRKV